MKLDESPPNVLRHAVVAIIVRDGRALFVQRSHAARAAAGYWTPVSGGVDSGEREIDAVAREVREEVGLDVEAQSRVASIPTHDGRYQLHFWTCRLIAGEPRPTSDEVADVGWFTPAELRTLRPVFEEDVAIVLRELSGRAVRDERL